MTTKKQVSAPPAMDEGAKQQQNMQDQQLLANAAVFVRAAVVNGDKDMIRMTFCDMLRETTAIRVTVAMKFADMVQFRDTLNQVIDQISTAAKKK